MTNAKYNLGYSHGYAGNLVAYPDDEQYMQGFNAGYSRAEKEWRDNQTDDYLPSGVSDAYFDCNYC